MGDFPQPSGEYSSDGCVPAVRYVSHIMHLMARLCLPELKSGGEDVPDWQMVNIILVWNHPEDGLLQHCTAGRSGRGRVQCPIRPSVSTALLTDSPSFRYLC